MCIGCGIYACACVLVVVYIYMLCACVSVAVCVCVEERTKTTTDRSDAHILSLVMLQIALVGVVQIAARCEGFGVGFGS